LVPESAAASCVTPGHDLLAFTNGVILRYANNSLTGASQLDGCTILSYAPAPGRLNAMSAVVRNEAGRTSALELRGEAEYGVAARVIPDTGNAAVSIALPQQGSNINTLYLFAEPGKLTLKQR
jgi:hypothetical protein